jgi:hypothetical protein
MATVFPEGISWKPKARSFDGQTGTHARLIALALANGFDVEADDDDNELTFIARPGLEKFNHRVIGEIRGGDKAVVRIMVKIE